MARGGVRVTGEEAQGWRKEWRRDGEVKRVPGDGTGDGRGAGMAAGAGRWWLLGASHSPPHLPLGGGRDEFGEGWIRGEMNWGEGEEAVGWGV